MRRRIKRKNRSEKDDVKVALLTIYLCDNLVKYESPREVEIQTKKFGYDPDNFYGVKKLITPEGKAVVLEDKDILLDLYESPDLVDLAIAGSSPNLEEEIEYFKTSGLLIARYSIFYGGHSEYTGKSAGEGGYSFDIPKKISAVKSFITNDKLLDAIVERDEKKIRTSLEKVNDTLERPILTTPFLSTALKYGKQKGIKNGKS